MLASHGTRANQRQIFGRCSSSVRTISSPSKCSSRTLLNFTSLPSSSECLVFVRRTPGLRWRRRFLRPTDPLVVIYVLLRSEANQPMIGISAHCPSPFLRADAESAARPNPRQAEHFSCDLSTQAIPCLLPYGYNTQLSYN